MDDERLKRGTYLTDKYFDEQLESIREIRAIERKFYQKITDLYATAIDYDKNPVGHKNVANKDVRKWITANLGVTKDNLSRYIKSFRERGMLKVGPAEDELRVNRILVPDLVGDRVQLTIILKLKQDDN